MTLYESGEPIWRAPSQQACGGALAINGVLEHFSLQRIAMNPQELGGFRLIVACAQHRPFDHGLFQDLDGLSEEKAGVH